MLRQRRGLSPKVREIGAGSDPAVSPAAETNGPGLVFQKLKDSRKRGIMASDISLAVGDGARLMRPTSSWPRLEGYRCPPRGALSYVTVGRDKGEMTLSE